MRSEHQTQLTNTMDLAEDRNRPRILLVGPLPPTKGGVTTFMLNLLASPLAQSVNFVPFTTSRPPKKNVIDNWGYRSVLRGGWRRIVVGIAVTIWHLAIFPVSIIMRRIDLVQVQASDYQVFWEAAIYTAMARLLGRPVIVRIGGAFDRFHGGASTFEQKLIMRCLDLPQTVIVQSLYTRNYIVRAGCKRNVIVLPNWLNDANWSDAIRQPVSPPVCLFIAGPEARRKGVEELLAVMLRLHEGACAVRFHLIAVPPLLMQRVQALGLSNIDALEGPASHRRVLELMQKTDIFLLPSHGEGFPNSLVEAMAAGMACIATPVGAVPEMASDGGVTLVPVGDSDALESAILTLAADPDLRLRMGEVARKTVSTRYTAAGALPHLSAAYRQLLA